jgi:hypothetical protein
MPDKPTFGRYAEIRPPSCMDRHPARLGTSSVSMRAGRAFTAARSRRAVNSRCSAAGLSHHANP